MANKTNFYSDGTTTYGATDFMAPWAATFAPGIFAGYAVSASSPAALSVSVAAGSARVGTAGHISRDDAATTVTITANTSGHNRIDLIVIDVNTTTKVTTIKAVQGVPSSSPVAPTAGSGQLALAQVLVGNNASVINSNVITDERVYSGLIVGGVSQPYIVESGTSGVWEYRKWSDGRAECWCIYTCSDVECTSAWGAAYDDDTAFGPVAYPFAFISAPAQTMHPVYTSSGTTCMIEPGSNTTTSTGTWYLYRMTSQTVGTVHIAIMVVGKWK